MYVILNRTVLCYTFSFGCIMYENHNPQHLVWKTIILQAEDFQHLYHKNMFPFKYHFIIVTKIINYMYHNVQLLKKIVTFAQNN